MYVQFLLENSSCQPVSHLPASQIPEGISGGSRHNGQATKSRPYTVDTGVGGPMLARPHTGDGSGDTKINHPIPRYYTKEGQIRLLGFYSTVPGWSLGATFRISVCLTIQQRLHILHLGACLLFGSGRCCTQQHPVSLPVNLCQSFAHGKNILW